MTPDLLTLPEVAKLYGCSTRTVRHRVACGLLPAFRLGAQLRFDPAELPDELPRATWERKAKP